MESQPSPASGSDAAVFCVTDTGVSFPWLEGRDPGQLSVWAACAALLVIRRGVIEHLGAVAIAEPQRVLFVNLLRSKVQSC